MEEEPSFPVMKWGLDREVTYTCVRSFGYQSMTTDTCLTASVSSAAGHSTTNDKYWDWAVATECHRQSRISYIWVVNSSASVSFWANPVTTHVDSMKLLI